MPHACRRCEACIVPRNDSGTLGILHAEARTCVSVDDGVRQRDTQRAVLVPIKVGIDDHAFRHAGCTVARIAMEIGVSITYFIREDRLRPIDASGNGLCIGIDKKFGWIEAKPFPGPTGPCTR